MVVGEGSTVCVESPVFFHRHRWDRAGPAWSLELAGGPGAGVLLKCVGPHTAGGADPASVVPET